MRIIIYQERRESSMIAEYQCPRCLMCFDSVENICPYCKYIGMNYSLGTQKLICENCGIENKFWGYTCFSCHSELIQQCSICGVSVGRSQLEEHTNKCLDFWQSFQENNRLGEQVQNNSVPSPEEQRMMKRERQIEAFKLESILPLCEMHRLSRLQINALQYMYRKSIRLQDEIIKDFQEVFLGMGYTQTSLQGLYSYIKNRAPIIIHVPIKRCIQFFVRDSHYRNQFETNTTSGYLSRNSRVNWEDSLFDGAYSRASDFQRVKYGVINLSNNPKGVYRARGYGQSYFVLRNHVRPRCTFKVHEEKGEDVQVGTLSCPFHVVSQMSIPEVKSVFQAAKGVQEPSELDSEYREIQIHGPVEFSKDIQKLYLHKTEVENSSKVLSMVEQFAQLFEIPYQFI